ncbi:hypothetical protein CAPTEDRAFT_186318 [Capitella teleta]|uniref:Uncharacterized protein n=1 Tax=Capitella teleta TaxID=283909 RepID=R7TIU1_CAPTE|nr:hypothetical protein CAPTEDRAFT_186318 [Capitella teleta]|eukprot:ELT93387.1 hypothetical protein CAPTEDRAFT_186318 [Capitella teleta]
MPYRCEVEGFSSVSTDGVWLYFWPGDEAQAKLWDRFVRSYRLERRGVQQWCQTVNRRLWLKGSEWDHGDLASSYTSRASDSPIMSHHAVIDYRQDVVLLRAQFVISTVCGLLKALLLVWTIFAVLEGSRIYKHEHAKKAAMLFQTFMTIPSRILTAPLEDVLGAFGRVFKHTTSSLTPQWMVAAAFLIFALTYFFSTIMQPLLRLIGLVKPKTDGGPNARGCCCHGDHQTYDFQKHAQK